MTSYQFRSRVCINGSVGDYGCKGLVVESASCGMQTIPPPSKIRSVEKEENLHVHINTMYLEISIVQYRQNQ